MAQVVTPVLESRLGGTEGLAYMVSIAGAGETRLILKFKPRVAEAEAARALEKQLGRLRGQLPEGASDPIIARIELPAQPVAYLAFSTEHHSAAEITALLKPIERELLQPPSEIDLLRRYGAHDPVLRLRLDLLRLAEHGLTVSRVRLDLARQGIATVPEGEFILSLQRENHLADLADLTFRTGHGDTVRLADIGTLERGARSDGFFARLDGRPVVLFEIEARVGLSALDAARAAHRQIASLRNHLPARVRYKVEYSCGACAAQIAKE
jgi:multidrug efflux pump